MNEILTFFTAVVDQRLEQYGEGTATASQVKVEGELRTWSGDQTLIPVGSKNFWFYVDSVDRKRNFKRRAFNVSCA